MIRAGDGAVAKSVLPHKAALPLAVVLSYTTRACALSTWIKRALPQIQRARLQALDFISLPLFRTTPTTPSLFLSLPCPPPSLGVASRRLCR